MKIKRIYFVCLTTTHFFQVLYYIHRVHWNEETEKILVWARKGKTRPEIKPYENLFDRVFYVNFADFHFPVRSQFDKLLKAGWLFMFTELGRYMRESVNGNMLVCLNDMDCCTAKYMEFMARHEDNSIVMLDEGSALYFEQLLNPPSKAARIIDTLLGVKQNLSFGTDPKIQVLMARHPDRLPHSKCRGRRVIPENDIFRDPVFMSGIQKQMADRLPEKTGRRVLWLGQPVEEFGLEGREALIHIFRIFAEENYRILVKPHPREGAEKYLRIAEEAGIEEHLKVLELGEFYWIPIEAYIDQLAPEAIACFFSTAAGRIRDMGYMCDTWYCYDLLKSDRLEEEYLLTETARPRTFRIHSRNELAEKLKKRNNLQEDDKTLPEFGAQEVNHDEDLAFFEHLCGVNKSHE